MESKINQKRNGAPKTLASQVGKITKPIFGKRGFADATLINDWSIIAGDHIASHSAPQKIHYAQGRKSKGTLHLRIDNSGLALQLQHLEAVLVERINTYFGFAAVDRISISQGPIELGTKKTYSSPRSLLKIEEKELSNKLKNVDDHDLHRALGRLGRAILGKTTK